MGHRTETDSMGPVEVPEDAYWGAQTQRSLENFAIGGERLPRVFFRAYGLLKQAAAEVNEKLGELPADIAGFVARAAGEVADGQLDAHFPLVVWQTGSGTQTNMNVNEVIASRANELAGGARGSKEPVHPNDAVNRGQSTNDTFPTAMHVAAALSLHEDLLPAIDALAETLDAKASAYADVVKTGRTHLQDATPLTLGQEIGAWASQLRLAKAAIEGVEPLLLELAVGGTAVGTGLNSPAGFGESVARALYDKTDLPFVSAPDKFAALGGKEAMCALSGALSTLASTATKIANDVRWLASGPRCGIGEITIPENEPGSSIMPGKVNPTQAEALIMLSLQVMGNHTTVSVAASQGNFQLNVCMPVIAFNVLQSLQLLADGLRSFDTHCARGIEPNRAAIDANVDRSLMLVTALSPHIGYDHAARIAKRAHTDGTTLREAALSEGVDPDDFDAWVRPEAMIGPKKPV